jgi:hypothetical protein
MDDAERRAHELASNQHELITVKQAMACGMARRTANRRAEEGRWRQVFNGVFMIGIGPVTWLHRAHGGVLAAGHDAGLSHRGSGGLFDLDACNRGPVELSVPYPREVDIAGVVAHRSRILPAAELRTWLGVPTTRIERTLVELGRYLPPLALEQAVESAFRRNLTNADAVNRYLRDLGHRLRGAQRLERVLFVRGESVNVAGSAAEVELIDCLRRRGIEPPVRQYEIVLGGGWKPKVDLCWPWRLFATEYYGTDFHSGAKATAYDLERENAIRDAGFELRCYGAGMVRRNPDGVAAQIARALAKHPIRSDPFAS